MNESRFDFSPNRCIAEGETILHMTSGPINNRTDAQTVLARCAQAQAYFKLAELKASRAAGNFE